MNQRTKVALGTTLALLVPSVAIGALSVADFSGGSPISAAAMNGNFTAVEMAFNQLETTVNDLAADLVAVQAQVGNGGGAASCPANMTSLGDFCIDNNARPSNAYRLGAVDVCYAANAHVCSAAELYICDHVQPGGSTCTDDTDGTGKLWTSTMIEGVNYGIAVSFDADNNTLVGETWTNPHPYYCCAAKQ